MRLLCPVIRLLICNVDRLRDYLSMDYRMAAQLICYDLPGLTSVTAQYSLEKSLCSSAIAAEPGLDLRGLNG